MKQSKALLLQAGILPKLRLGLKLEKGGVKSTGPHRVRILEDKIVKDTDHDTGKEVEFVRYSLEENGEKKYYQTRLKNKNGELNYLVQRFAEIAEGSEVILEMKRKGIKNYVEVIPVIAEEIEEETY